MNMYNKFRCARECWAVLCLSRWRRHWQWADQASRHPQLPDYLSNKHLGETNSLVFNDLACRTSWVWPVHFMVSRKGHFRRSAWPRPPVKSIGTALFHWHTLNVQLEHSEHTVLHVVISEKQRDIGVLARRRRHWKLVSDETCDGDFLEAYRCFENLQATSTAPTT